MINFNKNNVSTKIVISFCIFILIVCMISFTWWFINKDKTATLEIIVTPRDSKILIGDKIYSNGVYKIKPGEYTVNISKDNFNSYSSNITIIDGKKTKLYQALYQKDGSYSWYLENNEDDLLLTAIGDKNTETIQKDLVNKYPILKYIPYTDQDSGNRYKIDAQFENNKLNYIHITLNTCSSYSYDLYKNEAINWIKSKGINLDDYQIKYSSLCD